VCQPSIYTNAIQPDSSLVVLKNSMKVGVLAMSSFQNNAWGNVEVQ
jgi:hypothetical protein